MEWLKDLLDLLGKNSPSVVSHPYFHLFLFRDHGSPHLHPAPLDLGDQQAGRVGTDVPGRDLHFGSRQRELVTARPDTSTTQASAQSSGSTQAATASPTGLSLPAAWSA